MNSNNPAGSNKGNELSSSDLALIKELNDKDDVFSIADSVPPVIWIKKYNKNDLKKIFSHFQNTTSQIKIGIQGHKDIEPLDDIKPILLDQTDFNNEKQFVKHFYSFMTANQSYSVDSRLLIGALSALKELNRPLNIEEWTDILHKEIKKLNLKSSTQLFIDGIIANIIASINYLCELDKKSVGIESIFPDLLICLIRNNEIIKLAKLNNFSSEYLPLINTTNGHPYFFLHEAMKYDNKSFQLLQNMIADPIQHYDNDGNSFLHVCNISHLKTALELTPDINHRNRGGNTALHVAASEGNLDKIRFLLLHGADPDIKNEKGETFWTINSEKSDNLKLYQLYKQYGNVLKLPPEIVKQHGLNCGFYAVTCAANYHRAWQPELFKKAALPARKRDVSPKASSSLRQLREELNIPGKGAILSVQALQRVIEKTECKSMVCDITSLDQFMDVIKKAIEQNLPVIIPFSSAEGDRIGNPNQSPTGSTAHWATIIGWASTTETQGFLLAQYGKYFDTKSDELFKAFYEIDSSFPEKLLFKKKGGDWEISKNAMESNADTKTHTIPLTSLDDFRRKLVIVLPPGYNEELLKINKNTPH